MKRTIISLSLVLLLSGCVTNSQSYVQNQYQTAANAELAAWQKAQAKSDKECGKYGDDNPMPPEKAVETGKCYAAIVRQWVMPNAINPSAVNAYLIDYQTINVKYKKGEIDRDEANIELQKAWQNYSQKIDKQYATLMNQAYQADVTASQQRSKAMRELGQDLMQDGQIGQSSSGQCNSISIAPMASPGCKNVCINGSWSEVC